MAPKSNSTQKGIEFKNNYCTRGGSFLLTHHVGSSYRCRPCTWRPLMRWTCRSLTIQERCSLSKGRYWPMMSWGWGWGSCFSYIGSLQSLRTDSDKVFYANTQPTLVGLHLTFKSGVVCSPTFFTKLYWTNGTNPRGS